MSRPNTKTIVVGSAVAAVVGCCGVLAVVGALTGGGDTPRIVSTPARPVRAVVTTPPAPTAPARTTPVPVRTSAKPPPPPAADPRFATCTEAKRHGYGPYYQGVDPEYAWYRDRDGDGVVCE